MNFCSQNKRMLFSSHNKPTFSLGSCQKSPSKTVMSNLLICESDRLIEKFKDLICFLLENKWSIAIKAFAHFMYFAVQGRMLQNAQLVKQGLLKEARTLVLGSVTTRCTAFPFHRKPRLSLKKRCHGVSLQLFTKWHLK